MLRHKFGLALLLAVNGLNLVGTGLLVADALHPLARASELEEFFGRVPYLVALTLVLVTFGVHVFVVGSDTPRAKEWRDAARTGPSRVLDFGRTGPHPVELFFSYVSMNGLMLYFPAAVDQIEMIGTILPMSGVVMIVFGYFRYVHEAERILQERRRSN